LRSAATIGCLNDIFRRISQRVSSLWAGVNHLRQTYQPLAL
jgi:hypothetical protein